MALKQNSFETGNADGSAWTAANSSNGTAGDAFNQIGGTGTAEVETSNPFSGTSCVLFTATAANLLWTDMIDTAADSFSVRVYMRYTTLPDIEMQGPLFARTSADGHQVRLQLRTGGTMRLLDQPGTLTTTTATFPADGTWYRFSMWGDTLNTTTGNLHFRGYVGNSSTPITGSELDIIGTATTTALIQRCRVGKGTAQTANFTSWAIDDYAQNIGSNVEIGPVTEVIRVRYQPVPNLAVVRASNY